MADEKGTIRSAADQPPAIAARVLYGGGKLTPREARVLAAQNLPKTKPRKPPKKPAGA